MMNIVKHPSPIGPIASVKSVESLWSIETGSSSINVTASGAGCEKWDGCQHGHGEPFARGHGHFLPRPRGFNLRAEPLSAQADRTYHSHHLARTFLFTSLAVRLLCARSHFRNSDHVLAEEGEESVREFGIIWIAHNGLIIMILTFIPLGDLCEGRFDRRRGWQRWGETISEYQSPNFVHFQLKCVIC